MRVERTLLAGAAAGAAAGLLWVVVYRGAAPVPAALVAGHALAGLALAAAARRLGGRWGGTPAVVTAVLLALVAAPATVGPPYRAAILWGARGAVADVALGTVAVAAGLVLGRLWSCGRFGRAGAVLGTAACCAVPALVTLHLGPASRPSAAAVAADPGFRPGPVLVLGIDGGDWRVARPLMDAGRLPNLAAVLAEGRHGVLRSIVPTKSPVVWSSLFTGQPPAVHGIDDWYDADSRNLRAAPLWRVVGAHGGSALAVNVPGTWPPSWAPALAVVSGMPTPGLDTSGQEMPLGTVFSTEDEDGPVPTRRLLRRPAGWELEVRLGRPYRPSPRMEPQSVVVEMLRRRIGDRGGLHATLAVRLEEDAVVLSDPATATLVRLPRDGRPAWVRIAAGEVEAVLLASVLEAGDGRLRLYLSQALTAPWRPVPPFAAGLPPELLADRERPYVVEGPGWVASRDARVRRAVADMILEVEERHGELVEDAVRELRPQMVAAVLTVTDRMQHAFLSLHPPLSGSPLPDDLEGRDPVAAAYELADRILGRLRAAMPPDTLVVMLSDHGSGVGAPGEVSHHRLEGLWAAAGAGVAGSSEPLALGALDLLPTLLHCLGAAPARDLPGRVVLELCPDRPLLPPVDSYSAAPGAPGGERRIDPSREQQLRSLGYLD